MRIRVLLILIGTAVLLLALLWMAAAVANLYASFAAVSPTLARIFLGVFGVVLLGLIAGIGYYAMLFLRPARRSPRPIAPKTPTAAATVTLDAAQQHVSQIQDEVAKAALRQRSETIQQLMDSGDFQIVVFGLGSTGKTSTVNAILGRAAGAVDAAMGTTITSNAYRLQFAGVERKILLTDTPGLLEASIWGEERGAQARQLATEADVLLFVVENDLLQTEYAILQQLIELGKRSLLIFNKTDLYTDDEREAILTQLRQRTRSFLSPDDVVAIAANPAPVVLNGGDRIQPDPIIAPLLQRLSNVLRQEGEALMANNILLQAQRLSDDVRQHINQQRQQQAHAIIEKYQWLSGGVISVMPLPGLDLLATAAINTQMIIEIGGVYGCEVNRDRAKALALSLSKTLVGLGIVKGAFELWSTTLKLNIATALVGQAIQGVTGAYLTHVAGKSFIEYFSQEQTWGDGGMTDVVQEQFRLNRRDEFIKAFIQQAMTKVVDPLTQGDRQR